MVYKDGRGIKTGGAEGLARILGLETLKMKRVGQPLLLSLYLFCPAFFVSAFVSAFSTTRDLFFH